jgi:hypothetical protein
MALVNWIRDLSNTFTTPPLSVMLSSTLPVIDGIDAEVTALLLLPTIPFVLPDALRLQALCQVVRNFIHYGRIQTVASILEIKTTGMLMPLAWLNLQKAIKQRDLSVH